jgi:hypothetical protein
VRQELPKLQHLAAVKALAHDRKAGPCRLRCVYLAAARHFVGDMVYEIDEMALSRGRGRRVPAFIVRPA